jgi:uncharacterized protein YcbK (DUF882 family)
MSQYKYFTLEEFDSPDEPGSGSKMDPEFLQLLDSARARAGVPFKINSGYRTPAQNRKVGGVVKSPHMAGFAADISTRDSRTRWLVVEACIAVGFNRVGIGPTFVHVDCDPSKHEDCIWTYYNK